MHRLLRVFLALLLAVTWSGAAGAQVGTIAGRVVSATTREPVVAAQLRILDVDRAASTDSAGRFVLRDVPVGIRRLEVRRIGFAPVVRGDIPVSAGRAAELEIALAPVAASLGAVTVRPSYFPASADPSAPVSTQTLTAEEIRRAPGVQEDVVRAASVLPGVSVIDPVANGIVVRGGGTAENLYVVDGVEVSSINHFSTPGNTAGVLSVFPVALVSEASLSAGGFGARYGDRTSSVTTVALREGSRAEHSAQATLSATGLGLIAEGPLGDAASFIVGARRSYLDLLFSALGLPFVPTYTDLTAKVVASPSRRDRVSAFVAGAVDRIGVDATTADNRYDLSRAALPAQDGYFSGITWSRALARGRWATTLSHAWTRFDVSQSDSGSATQAPEAVFRARATEGETGLRTEVAWQRGESFALDGGVSGKYNERLRYDVRVPGEFRTDAAGAPQPLAVDTSFRALRGAAWVQAATRPLARLRLTTGGRVDAWDFLDVRARLAPRASAAWTIDERSTLTLAGGRYWQAPPLAWLVGDPTNPGALRPFRADQVVLGWQSTPRPALRLQVEAYAKRYANYPARAFRPRAVLQPTGTDVTTDVPLGLEPIRSVGTGRAWGIEAFAQKRLTDVPVYWLLAVGANRTRFVALDGIESRGAFDLPLAVNGQLGWRPNRAWELAARLRAGSGLPTTPFIESGPDAGSLDYARYDAGPRLAPIFSVDVRADRRWTLGERGQIVAYLDVQDATARRNESFPVWNQRKARVERQLFAGFLPSIGITWERRL